MTHRSDRKLRAAAVVAAFVLMIVGGRYALEAGAPPLSLAGEIVVSGSFLLTGLFAWSRRPSNRMGLVMVLVGLSLLLIPFA